MRQLYGVGETVLDVVFKNDQPVAAVPGGSAFNAMISLGRSIGVEYPEVAIRMVTETGDDHIGDIVVRFMEDNNVMTDCVTRNKGTQTHISMAFLDDRNDAQYEFYKDHAHASLSPSKLDVKFGTDDILLTSSFFSINPVIRDYTQHIYKSAHDAGAIIYYDVNFRRAHQHQLSEVIDNVLENMAFSDIVRGSTEDFEILFGCSDPRQVYDKYVSKYCRLFICTDGAGPLTVITPTMEKVYVIPPIETVSTIGAGDNFNAGIVASLVENGVTKEALATAGADLWDRLIERGLAFSAEVCQSIYNYIEIKK